MGSFIAQGNSLILFISTSIGSMKNLLTLIWERVVYAGASFFLPHLMAQLSQMPLVIFLLFFLATVMVIFFGFFLQRTYRKLRNYFSTGKSASKQASSFFPLAKKENQKKRLARQTKKELLFIDKRFPAIAVVAVLLTAMFAYNWPERYQLANLIPTQTLQRSVSNPTNSTQVAGEADSSSEKETLSIQTKTILEKHPNLYALLAPTETSTQNLKLGGMLLTRHGELFIASGTVVSDSIQRHGIKNINLGTNSVTSRVIKNGTISSEDLASTLTISRLKLDQALATTEGGTGLTHYVPGDLLYYAQGQTLTRLPIGSVNQVLKADGSGLSWQPETSYSASGQLLQLANQNFSLREGTLDDGKICTYSVTTGLECTTTAGSVGVNYWTMSSNNLYPNNLTDNLALGATNAGSAKLYVNGNVGVGTTNPGAKFEIYNTSTSVVATDEAAMFISNYLAPSADIPLNGNRSVINSNLFIPASNTKNIASLYNYGGRFAVENSSTSGTIAYLIGSEGWAYQHGGSGSIVENLVGALGDFEIDSGSVTNAKAVEIWAGVYGGTASNLYGIHIVDIENSGGTVANRYGIRIDPFTGSVTTNDFAFYSAATQKSYFAGNVGIGTTNPSYPLDVNGVIRTTTNLLSSLDTPGTAFQVDGVAGSERVMITVANGGGGAVKINNLVPLGWTSAGANNSLDVGLSRGGINKLYVGNGTAGDYTGTLIAGNIGIGTTVPLGLFDVRSSDILATTGDLVVKGDGTITVGRLSGTTGSSNNFKVQSRAGEVVLSVNDNRQNSVVNITSYFDGRLGVGEVSPGSKLSVKGGMTVGNDITYSQIAAPTDGMIIKGNVGIGTTNPGTKLEIQNGSLKLSHSEDSNYQATMSVNYSTGNTFNLGSIGGDFLQYDYLSGSNVTTLGLSGMTTIIQGNVGIGTTSPVSKLSVSGGDITVDAANYLIAGTSGGTRTILNSNLVSAYYSTETDPRYTMGRDGLGSGLPGITMRYENGSNWLNAQHGVAIGAPADRTLGLFTSNGTALTERVRIDSGGNVGIGTTNPGAKLQIAGNMFMANTNFGAMSTKAVTLRVDEGYDAFRFGVPGNWSMDFKAYSAGGGRLDIVNSNNGDGGLVSVASFLNNGNVGIGTTNPGTKLDVIGNTRITNSGGTTALSLNGGPNNFATFEITSTAAFANDSIAPSFGIIGRSPTSVGGNNMGAGFMYYLQASDSIVYTTGSMSNYWIDPANHYSAMSFMTRGSDGQTPRLTILNTGNVGIGTTSPGAKLDVVGNANIKGVMYVANNGNSATVTLNGNIGNALLASVNAGYYGDIIGGTDGLDFSNTNHTILKGYYDTTISATNGPVILQPTSGNVGIGTTSPGYKLDISTGNNTDGLRVSSSNDNTMLNIANTAAGGTAWYFDSSGGSSGFGQGNLTLGVGAAYTNPKVTFQSSGNVGIGTTNPGAKLEVNGVVSITAGWLQFLNGAFIAGPHGAGDFTAGTGLAGYSFENDANTGMYQVAGDKIGFSTAGYGRMVIDSTGNIGIGTTAPNYKLDVEGLVIADGIRSAMGFDIYQVPDPTVPTGAVGAGGSVDTGDHWYSVSYTTAIGETHTVYTAAVVTTTAGNNTVTLTIPVSTDPRVTGRKIYRTKAGGAAYSDYLLTTIANNTVTNYVDTTADSGLSGAVAAGFYRPNTTSNDLAINGTKSLMLDSKETHIGYSAGASLTGAGGRNVLIGSSAGLNMTTGQENTLIGFGVNSSLTNGSTNTAVGIYALSANTGGHNNALGAFAGFRQTSGAGNVFIGDYTMQGGSSRAISQNTIIGSYAGYNATGNGNVFLGYQAGYYETGANKLFIDNAKRSDEADARTKSLLYGIFDASVANQYLTLNGQLQVTGTGNSYLMGNIGIGTTAPSEKLEVAGNIRVTGGSFIDDGTTLNVPDYVFEPGYNLKSLPDLETYINQNLHLPNVPSQDQIKKTGMNYGSMLMSLLEKTEENTLYTIDNYHQITQLDSRLNSNNLSTDDKMNIISQTLTNLDTKMQNIASLQAQVTAQTKDLTELQKQMTELQTQAKPIIDFYLALDLKDMLTKDTLGNVTLLEGKITAKDIEALNTFKAKDIEATTLKLEDNKTSGKAIVAAGTTEITIMTPEANADAKIYITPLDKLSGRSLYIDPDKIEDGASFSVDLDGEVLDKDIRFNWLIIK